MTVYNKILKILVRLRKNYPSECNGLPPCWLFHEVNSGDVFSPKIYSKFFLNQGTGKQFKNAQLYTLSHGILNIIVKTNL